eukprot:scaffold301_cov243-Pinguiococcus_pyrenoidosus.AAC.119
MSLSAVRLSRDGSLAYVLCGAGGLFQYDFEAEEWSALPSAESTKARGCAMALADDGAVIAAAAVDGEVAFTVLGETPELVLVHDSGHTRVMRVWFHRMYSAPEATPPCEGDEARRSYEVIVTTLRRQAVLLRLDLTSSNAATILPRQTFEIDSPRAHLVCSGQIGVGSSAGMSDDRFLFFGSSRGKLYAFAREDDMGEAQPRQGILHPIASAAAHGHLPISCIKVLKSGRVVTLGHDGYLREFAFRNAKDATGRPAHTMELVAVLSYPFVGCNTPCLLSVAASDCYSVGECGANLHVAGFQGPSFVVWDVAAARQVTAFPAGGCKRVHDFRVEEDGVRFCCAAPQAVAPENVALLSRMSPSRKSFVKRRESYGLGFHGRVVPTVSQTLLPDETVCLLTGSEDHHVKLLHMRSDSCPAEAGKNAMSCLSKTQTEVRSVRAQGRPKAPIHSRAFCREALARWLRLGILSRTLRLFEHQECSSARTRATFSS